jgi:regulator of replication initiation timing
MSKAKCEHGQLRRQCELCAKNAEIAELQEARAKAIEYMHSMRDENATLRKKLATDEQMDRLIRETQDAYEKGRSDERKRKLTKIAQVGNAVFHVGVSERLVIERAHRQYEYEQTPERVAKRTEQLTEFLAAIGEARE